MPAKKSKTRTSAAKAQPLTKANKLTVVIICALMVVVGVFLVYKSFAAAVFGY